MKALFVGLGSIGQRHLRNLKSVYSHNLQIIAFRSKESNLIIKSDMSTERCESLESYYGIKCFYDFDSVLKEKPDMAFITNPSSLHIPIAIKLARIGCHLFIEKPLSVNLNGVDELKEICEQNSVKIFIGFQMHFHPLLQQVWDLLKNGMIGNLLYARAKFGTYLPFHHPYEDYRMGYAARDDLGGGVIMCLMHELDYLCYLFGFPQTVIAFGGKLSGLQMTAEDTANIILHYRNNFSVSLTLSFAERGEERTLQIVGDKGKFDLDFYEQHLKVYNADKEALEVFQLKDFNRNNLFVDEIKHFIDCIENNRELRVTLNEGINSLKIAIAIKESISKKKIIKL